MSRHSNEGSVSLFSSVSRPYKILLADDERKAFDIYLAYGQMLEKFRFIGPLTTDYQVRCYSAPRSKWSSFV